MGLFLLSGVFLNLVPQAFAADYPSENIRWVVGAKPGGGVDIYARTVGRYMEKYLPDGIHVIVENRPGAGHSIANTYVYNAKPDGHTIGSPFMPGLYVMQIVSDVNFDMTKINWLGMIDRAWRTYSLSPKSKFKSLKDLQGGEKVRVGIVGFASEAIILLTLKSMGVNAEYIPGHKNAKDGIMAAIRGDVDLIGFSYSSSRQFIEKKQIIPVMITGAEGRQPELPDVPTLTELGYKEVDSVTGNWRAISMTPGVPQDRVEYLRDVIWKTLNDKELLAWSKKAKRPVNPRTGEETEKIMQKLMKIAEGYTDFFKPFFK